MEIRAMRVVLSNVWRDYSMRRFMFTVAALLLLAVAALPSASQAQSAQARVRVMHASPDAPSVDVYVNGSKVLSDVPFFTVSGFIAVPAGEYRFQVTPAGAGLESAVIDATATLAGGQDYTVAAIDRLANIQPGILEDDNSAPPSGQARVRIFHASPDAPAVDIKLAGTATTVLAGAEFGDYAYLEVPAGTYRFDITPAGSSTVVYTTPPLRFEAGWGYSLTAAGLLGAEGSFAVQSRIDRIAQ